MHQFKNLDASTSIFFKRELEFVKARSYDVEYQDLTARTLFPVSSEAGAFAQIITWTSYDRVGMAQIISSYAKDLPRADISGKQESSPVRAIGLSFAYTVDEILTAEAVGKPLEQRRVNAVMRGSEETIDHIAWYGDAATGLPGFLTNANIPTGPVAPGAGGGTTWVTKTPEEILDDVNNLFGTTYSVTRKKERPSRLLLPIKQWNYITTKARSANSDTTIAQYLVQNSPFLSSMDDIMAIPEMEGAGTGGADLMVIYTPDPDKLTMEVPLELQFLPAQEIGLSFEVPAWAKTGGTIVYKPLSARFAYGI
jgi:hypothetical protein